MAMDMIFGEGPILTGNWYNPKTGDSFTVRDTYFEDNNFYVLTTDGRRMDYNLMSQYVQSDKPIPKMEQPQAQPQTQIPQEVLSQMSTTENNDLMTEDDIALITGQAPKVQANFVSPTKAVAQVPKDEDVILIERLLKRATAPKVNCLVQWNKFPEKQFEMLDMMAVDAEKIVEYFLQSIDLEALREEVKFGIEKYIYDYFGNEKEIAEFNESFDPEVVEEHVEKPVEKPKSTKKSTTKKTTKKK